MFFDAHWWFDGPPSGRNVLRSLVAGWAKRFPGDQISLALPARTEHRWEEVRRDVERAILVPTKLRPQALSSMLEIGRLGRSADILIAQNFTPLVSKRPGLVALIYDLIFEDHPEWFTRRERCYLAPIAVLAQKASAVVTISETEADRIRIRHPRLAAKVHNVGLGVPHGIESAAPAPLESNLRPRSFMVAVGRLNVRKNLARLIEAVLDEELVSESFPLVIVGERDGAYHMTDKMRRASEEGSVRFIGFATDGNLKWLYQECALFVFPSLDEGFGLPVLEAVSQGAKVAMSDIPVLREFNIGAELFDPTSSAAIGLAIRRALSRPRQEAQAIPEVYSWTGMAERVRSAARQGS